MSDTETKKLSVWEYFEKCNDRFKAKCLLCHKILSYSSTSHNLKNHLKCVHSDVVDVNTNIKTFKRQRNGSSANTKEIIRKAFTKVEGDKVAMCNFCHKILSYRTTIANLRAHLEKVHRDESLHMLQIKSDETDDYDDDDSDGQNNTYLQPIEDDDDGSSCYNPETDSRDVHNNKNKYVGEDGEVYTEVIYLDEELARKAPIKKYSSKNTSKNYKKLFRRRMMSFNETFENQSSDEELRMKQSPVSNELDKFGQYIATLLSSLPKYVCTKMQMNIVNQIMEEKLKIETETANISSALNNNPNKQTVIINTAVQENNDESQNEVSDVLEQEADSKHHKYIITGNADIVKNV